MLKSVLKYLFLFIVLILHLNLPTLYAQNYVLTNWTVEDGLSSNDVKDIFQDKDGFMWIATEHGLNKFDGYAFKNFRYHPNDSTTMGANFINNICEDDHGNIGVSLGVGIFSKYDKLLKNFRNYYFPKRNTYIIEMKFIPNLGILLATNHGLFKFDPSSDKLQSLINQGKSLAKPVFKIFPTTENKVYLSTADGFEYYDIQSKSLEPVHFIKNIDTFNFEYYVHSFHKDSKGVYRIQTGNGNLCESLDGIHFKKSSFKIENYTGQPFNHLFIFEDKKHNLYFSNRDKLFNYNQSSQFWNSFSQPGEPPAFYFNDQSDNIWTITKDQALLKWNGANWEHIIELGEQLKYWEINKIFVDNKNGIWLSTKGKGVWRIYKRKWPINSINNNNKSFTDFPVTSLILSDSNNLLLATNSNLFEYNIKTSEMNPFFPKDKNPIWGLRPSDFQKDKNGNLWIGTHSGLIIADIKSKNYKFIETVNIDGQEVPINYIRCILIDQSERIWIGTTNGLFLYDNSTQKYHYYSTDSNQKGAILSKNIQSVHQINSTDFLIGFIKEGTQLLSLNPNDFSIKSQKITYKNGINNHINTMTTNTFYNSGSDYWVGTFSKGLLKLDLETLTMYPISKDFPIIPNVKAIQKGTKGNLWVSSIDGIRSVNPQDQTYYRFSKASGLLSNYFFINSSVQDNSGILYFGGTNGLNKIQPSDWNNQDTIATPILTDFKKYNESITFEKDLDQVKSISFSHQEDYVTFEFVSPTFDNPRDVQYAYQLEGFDANWSIASTQLSATYTNLPPGNYQFKIRAGNKGGFLNSKIKQVEIIVTPPFWQTSWFIVLVIGSLIFAYWMLFKIQSVIRLNRMKIIAEVRKKAADDFHDELGHRLTKIVLFVESLMLQKGTFPKKAAHTLLKIQDNANELYYSTKDFIWAMNPSKDSALELFILLRDFGDELFEDTSIQFSVEGLKEEYKDFILKMDWKRQLVMIFKEAMNNALKHSKCDEVILKIEQSEKKLKIILKDNGEGFILNHKKFGYGLGSMINRSKKVGGKLVINSLPGKGTEVALKIT